MHHILLSSWELRERDERGNYNPLLGLMDMETKGGWPRGICPLLNWFWSNLDSRSVRVKMTNGISFRIISPQTNRRRFVGQNKLERKPQRSRSSSALMKCPCRLHFYRPTIKITRASLMSILCTFLNSRLGPLSLWKLRTGKYRSEVSHTRHEEFFFRCSGMSSVHFSHSSLLPYETFHISWLICCECDIWDTEEAVRLHCRRVMRSPSLMLSRCGGQRSIASAHDEF